MKYFGKAKNGNGPDSLQGMRHKEMRQILFHNLKGFDEMEALHLLDVGCGEGLMLNSLLATGLNLHGCDWKPAINVTDAIQYKSINLNQHGLTSYSDAKFDVVISSDVIEHLESPAAILREMSRVLKPRGIILLSFPNSWNIPERVSFLLTSNFRRFRSERRSAAWGHISFFTPEIFESISDRAGLAIHSISGGMSSGHLAFRGYYLRVPSSVLLTYNVYAVLRHA